ncbi:hypothetical protein DV736_g5352, partial [Chaetothyriales sp. CBS 134916]
MAVGLGNGILLLDDVAYCPRLLTTLVSLRQLRKKGYYWDNETDPTTLRRRDRSIVTQLNDKYGQYVLEYCPNGIQSASFITYRKKGTQDPKHWNISSTPPKGDIHEHEGERIAVDFHDYEPGINDYTSQMLLTCRVTGYIWDYYMTNRSTASIIAIFNSFLGMMKAQHNITVKVIECDNEITEVKPQVAEFLSLRDIILEPSALYTQAQNGGAERSGGVIKEKARAMRLGAKLPHQLWPEIGRTAVYLYNRTPNYRSKWKSPYDRLYAASAKAQGIPSPERRPNQAHLRVFGCKAYAMTPKAQQKFACKLRLAPKAWIGFLVGYRSSNIYRVWIPTIDRVINTRDVIFNEDEINNGEWTKFRDELLQVSASQIAELVRRHALVDEQDDIVEPHGEDTTEAAIPVTDLADTTGQQESGETPLDPYEDIAAKTAYAPQDDHNEIAASRYPTPPESLPSALLSHSIRPTGNEDIPCEEGPKTIPWQAAFLAGIKSVPIIMTTDGKTLDKANIERYIRQGVKVHQNELPSLPRSHGDIKKHPLRSLLYQAELDHLQSHINMNSWTEIPSSDPRAAGKQILDSRFDLELNQYDIVNAFINALINEDTFMKLPPGYKKNGMILKLNKALYGLRVSPLLWQKELIKTLNELGYSQIPYEPCCFIKAGVLIFFFVDDIIIAYRQTDNNEIQTLCQKLQTRYKITGGDPIKWFLSMEVIRDRPSKKI